MTAASKTLQSLGISDAPDLHTRITMQSSENTERRVEAKFGKMSRCQEARSTWLKVDRPRTNERLHTIY